MAKISLLILVLVAVAFRIGTGSLGSPKEREVAPTNLRSIRGAEKSLFVKREKTFKGKRKRNSLKTKKGKAPRKRSKLNRKQKKRKGSSKSKWSKKGSVDSSNSRKKKRKGQNKQGKKNKPKKRKGIRKGSNRESLGRVLTVDGCEYLDLSMITSRPSCITGTKMVIQRKTPNIARQFLIIEGKPIYAFWIRTVNGDGKKTKFWDCENPTDITNKLVCKAVPELIEKPLMLSGTASPSPAPGSAPAPSPAAPAPAPGSDSSPGSRCPALVLMTKCNVDCSKVEYECKGGDTSSSSNSDSSPAPTCGSEPPADEFTGPVTTCANGDKFESTWTQSEQSDGTSCTLKCEKASLDVETTCMNGKWSTPADITTKCGA